MKIEVHDCFILTTGARMGCESMDEKRRDCQLEFDRLWERLSKGDEKFNGINTVNHQTDIRITKLETNLINLIKSMGNLTKSIWGAVTVMASIGIGFIIWYIQSL